MLPKIPTNTKEFEEGFNDLKRDVVHDAGKAVTTVGKDVSGQVALTDFVKEMYAPSAKGSEAGSGETAGFTDQITPKPGEMLGNIAGAPLEPGQQVQGESALSQVSIPMDKLASSMIGSQIEPGENPPSEEPLEQLLPSANQLSGHMTGSIPTQKVTPHMETAGQQIVPSVDELTGILGINPSETSGIPGQRQAPVAGQNPVDVENMQGPDTMQHPASHEQQQQASQKMELDRGGIDPAMQMSQQERVTLTEEQKAKREQMMLHDREYRKFGTPLDPIGSLEEQVAKVRQQKEQEEKQIKEEEERQKEEEKRQKEQQEKESLPEPSTKPKPGDPNVAIGQSQKKTEVHRGTAG